MTGAVKLQLSILLCAQPDPDYAPTSHRGSVVIAPREFLVSSLSRAVETYAVFALDNALGPANLVGAGLVRLDGVPHCRVSHDGKILEVDSEGRATGLQYRDPGMPPPKWRHLGELVRWLREDAELLRRDLAAAVGIATETVRNLETGRHAASPWTWQRLLGHPALADLPALAKEAGLQLPPGAAGELRNPQLRGSRGTTAPAGGRGHGGGDGGDAGGDGEGSEGGGAGSAPDRGTR